MKKRFKLVLFISFFLSLTPQIVWGDLFELKEEVIGCWSSFPERRFLFREDPGLDYPGIFNESNLRDYINFNINKTANCPCLPNSVATINNISENLKNFLKRMGTKFLRPWSAPFENLRGKIRVCFPKIGCAVPINNPALEFYCEDKHSLGGKHINQIAKQCDDPCRYLDLEEYEPATDQDTPEACKIRALKNYNSIFKDKINPKIRPDIEKDLLSGNYECLGDQYSHNVSYPFCQNNVCNECLEDDHCQKIKADYYKNLNTKLGPVEPIKHKCLAEGGDKTQRCHSCEHLYGEGDIKITFLGFPREEAVDLIGKTFGYPDSKNEKGWTKGIEPYSYANYHNKFSFYNITNHRPILSLPIKKSPTSGTLLLVEEKTESGEVFYSISESSYEQIDKYATDLCGDSDILIIKSPDLIRPHNIGAYFTMGVEGRKIVDNKNKQIKNNFIFLIRDLSDVLGLGLQHLLPHELGHYFGLADEYNESSSYYDSLFQDFNKYNLEKTNPQAETINCPKYKGFLNYLPQIDKIYPEKICLPIQESIRMKKETWEEGRVIETEWWTELKDNGYIRSTPTSIMSLNNGVLNTESKKFNIISCGGILNELRLCPGDLGSCFKLCTKIEHNGLPHKTSYPYDISVGVIQYPDE